jgi:tyrosyl-tRNA synthetase
VFLTDLRQSEIDQMQADVAAGTLHPMEVKKRLARTIVAGFHSEEAAQAADENWARQFQQKSDDVEGVEEVRLNAAKLGRGADGRIRVSRLLSLAALTKSSSEADRKVKEGAVQIKGDVIKDTHILIDTSEKFPVRLGKIAKKVDIYLPQNDDEVILDKKTHVKVIAVDWGTGWAKVVNLPMIENASPYPAPLSLLEPPEWISQK